MPLSENDGTLNQQLEACRSVPQHAAASQNFLGDHWCLHGRLVLVIVTNCALEPTNVRYCAMARGFVRNSCTNHAVQPYSIAHHFEVKHASFAVPSALAVTADEREMVVNSSTKKMNNKRSHHEMDEEDAGDMA